MFLDGIKTYHIDFILVTSNRSKLNTRIQPEKGIDKKEYTGLFKTFTPPREKEREILGPNRWVPVKVHLNRKV